MGAPLLLVWAPDWQALRTVLNWVGRGDEQACPACSAPKGMWKRALYGHAARRRLTDFCTACYEFLRLCGSDLDIVYDPLHCAALAISHAVLDSIYLWVQAHCSEPPYMMRELLQLFESAKLTKKYKPAKSDAIQRKEWAIGNKGTKVLLKPDTFWKPSCQFTAHMAWRPDSFISGPGYDRVCPACSAPKHMWQRALYRHAAPQRLNNFWTPCFQFLRLCGSDLDVVYDPSHCAALVISHAVFQSIYLWVQAHCSEVPSMMQGASANL